MEPFLALPHARNCSFLPEALMYEPEPNGQLRLGGVEYIVSQEAWDAEHAEPPTLLVQQLHLVIRSTPMWQRTRRSASTLPTTKRRCMSMPGAVASRLPGSQRSRR